MVQRYERFRYYVLGLFLLSISDGRLVFFEILFLLMYDVVSWLVVGAQDLCMAMLLLR